MGLRPTTFLLGLLGLLLGQGTTQALAVPEKNTVEEHPWPALQPMRNFSFPCKPERPTPEELSKSVHTLRPSDVQVVAAIWDLDMAPDLGRGDLKMQPWTEKRPPQVCMLATVLSDIIRHFNPSVLSPMCPPGKSAGPADGAQDLWAQARELVRSMKENPQLDFQSDWKLINVFFSNASQCHLCPVAEQTSHVMDTMGKLTQTLDYLQQEVPKAFVNLVDLSEVLGLELSLQEEICNCTMDTSMLYRVVMRWSYQETWKKLLAVSKYNEQESFVVVFQPIFSESSPLPVLENPQLQDPTSLALYLWNSMMKSTEEKDEPFNAEEIMPMKCPTQKEPYLFTYKNSNYLSSPRKRLKTPELKEGAEVRCQNKSPSDSIPTSVHRLKPADIKVIGALGDSITVPELEWTLDLMATGNGAGSIPKDMFDVLTQYRGLSWSAGGDENISTVTTLPNILREFNPALKGFSLGKGKENSTGAHFNQAVAGAKAEDLPAQARRLVDLMKNDTDINFQEDWKIITLFIGGNDLCAFCSNLNRYSPQNFSRNIENALDILHAEVPRAFVNLVTMLEIIALRELYQTTTKCPKLMLNMLCPCVMKTNINSQELATLIEVNRQYQEETHLLVESGRYDTKEDFTVVVQPFLENVAMPKTAEGSPDTSFFAPDCFHFSAKAHARAASGLWNNMLEPINQKTSWHEFEIKSNLTCPDKAWPFFSTYKNLKSHGTLVPCMDRAPSPFPPTSVHALRPADVQVVAALGDSLTAGSGIATKEGEPLNDTKQYRGLSFSSGGDDSLKNVTTLPNIFREFNPNLTGYAVGIGDANDTNAFLNQAVPRAKTRDLMDQAHALVQRMKADTRVNFQRDWKVITVLIGGTDLCDYCTDSKTYSAANFTAHLRKALDVLHREVPRALVNLVDFMSPSAIREVFLKNQDRCPVQQARVLCNCVLDQKGKFEPLDILTQAYQDRMRQLVDSGRYDTRKDFSVVLQPFFQNLRVPNQQDGRPDTSFFAPDCIHPNQKFHSQLSRALWANMLQPLRMKSNTLNLAAVIPISCPTKMYPYFFVERNTQQPPDYPQKPSKRVTRADPSDVLKWVLPVVVGLSLLTVVSVVIVWKFFRG